MIKNFDNLYDFFNYIEFCPLCKNRTFATTTFPAATVCDLGNKELVIYDCETPQGNIVINIFDNTVNKSYEKSYRSDISKVIFGRQCKRYHFFYNGVADISKKDLKISNISLDKYHFIMERGTNHYTVNGSMISESTHIRITTPGFNTRELFLPYINFDLFSSKNIKDKLQKIQLLG